MLCFRCQRAPGLQSTYHKFLVHLHDYYDSEQKGIKPLPRWRTNLGQWFVKVKSAQNIVIQKRLSLLKISKLGSRGCSYCYKLVSRNLLAGRVALQHQTLSSGMSVCEFSLPRPAVSNEHVANLTQCRDAVYWSASHNQKFKSKSA